LIVTQAAVCASVRDRVSGLAYAPLWGLVRSLQSERPELVIGLLDVDDVAAALGAIAHAVSLPHEPQLAFRDGVLLAPRLARLDSTQLMAAPETPAWSLQVQSSGTLAGLALLAHDELAPGASDVRVAVRAAGVNFRDVLVTLGMYPGEPGPIGAECAGVVVEVGADVQELAVVCSVSRSARLARAWWPMRACSRGYRPGCHSRTGRPCRRCS